MQTLGIDPEDIRIDYYELDIPPVLENALGPLYQNIHSCLAYFKLYSAVKDINSYVERRHHQITAIFLFEFKNGKITVLNQFIKADQEQVERFSRFVFTRFGTATLIIFPVIETVINRLSFPFRQATLTDDFIVPLPKTVAHYEAGLGKSTRRTTRACINKLHKKYSDVRFEFYENDAVDEQHIRCIANMHKARLRTQHVPVDALVTERRVKLAKECDTMVGLVRIDGRICAGSISYRVGDHYFASMLAHDPHYNADRVGFLCAYHTVCESIKRHAKAYHFGQSRFRYKENLLCVRHPMNHVEIFRSRGQLIRHYRRVIKMIFKGSILRLELWSNDPVRQAHALPRGIINTIHFVRRLYTLAGALLCRITSRR